MASNIIEIEIADLPEVRGALEAARRRVEQAEDKARAALAVAEKLRAVAREAADKAQQLIVERDRAAVADVPPEVRREIGAAALERLADEYDTVVSDSVTVWQIRDAARQLRG